MKFSRVHPVEWATGFCGFLLLAAMFLPWFGDETALSSVGVLDALLALAGLGGVLVPFIVAGNRLTNVPIVAETFVSELATITLVALMLKLIWTRDGGVEAGFIVGLTATALLVVSGWKSTARES